MWRQLIDHDEAWPESSSSAMFTFAMITGVKNGWLDAATYGPAARKAWIAVVGYIDQNQDITSVCEGTGKQNNSSTTWQRKRRTGDFHGRRPSCGPPRLCCASGFPHRPPAAPHAHSASPQRTAPPPPDRPEAADSAIAESPSRSLRT